MNAVPHLSDKVENFVQMVNRLLYLTIALAISEFLNIFNLIYQRNPKSRNKPIKGYLQLVKTDYLCGLCPDDYWHVVYFTGFGAMAAVLMLVFQNTILSLVASVQISSV